LDFIDSYCILLEFWIMGRTTEGAKRA